MAHASGTKLPKWQRWMPIVMTTRSGKTLFVCLVCGVITPAPNRECGPESKLRSPERGVDPRIAALPGLRNCSDVEWYINEQIAEHLEDELLLPWAEDQLRPIGERRCSFCRGYGCQECIGKGRRHG